MAIQNKLSIESITSTVNPIEINLVDNNVVCGFGDPIPIPKAKEIVQDYFSDYDNIELLIKDIINSPAIFSIIRNHPGFNALQQLFDPTNHIVSGVFGKEAILQLLAQKKCEGIRYAIGKYQNKPTIVLFGVKCLENDDEQSEPIPSANEILSIKHTDPHDPKNSLFIEVHKQSKTVAEMRSLLIGKDNFNAEEVSNQVFSAF